MARGRLMVGYLATKFATNLRPDSGEEGLTRGAWEQKRKDPKPQPEPEPPLNGPAYQQDSYRQNQQPHQQQQQSQYSDPQYQTQQPPYHDPNLYNAPNNPAGYAGQPPNNGGYAPPYSGQPSQPLAGQNQYGAYQNQQPQNSAMGPFYGQGAPANYTYQDFKSVDVVLVSHNFGISTMTMSDKTSPGTLLEEHRRGNVLSQSVLKELPGSRFHEFLGSRFSPLVLPRVLVDNITSLLVIFRIWNFNVIECET
ncbi:MAG: hypothetical protein Q9195_004088 [Heterodermia aff. obscurata]